MKLIGKGSFSRVYRAGNDDLVYIKTEDPVKECMSCGWFPSSRLFPKVTDSNKPGYDYMMSFYPRKKSLKSALKPAEWSKYQELRQVFNHIQENGLNCDYNGLYQAFKTIKTKSVREALLGALDSLANYGQDIGFEISPRNVSVSNTGNLILLDCFFMKSQLK